MCTECSGTDAKGPKGTPEPLSSCSGCSKSIHSTCANVTCNTDTTIELTTLVAKGTKWYCEDCKSCDGCSDTKTGGLCLGCCGCHKNFHLTCLDPVPEKKVKRPWRCRHCLQVHKKGAATVEQPKEEKKRGRKSKLELAAATTTPKTVEPRSAKSTEKRNKK